MLITVIQATYFFWRLFTLNTFYKANKRILSGKDVTEDAEAFVVDYWSSVVKYMKPWRELCSSELSKKELREKYIVTQGVVIKALGQVGSYFYDNQKVELDPVLKGIENINWRRTAGIWHKRAIRTNGRMIANEQAVRLIANMIKKLLQIPLNDEDKEIELGFEHN